MPYCVPFMWFRVRRCTMLCPHSAYDVAIVVGSAFTKSWLHTWSCKALTCASRCLTFGLNWRDVMPFYVFHVVVWSFRDMCGLLIISLYSISSDVRADFTLCYDPLTLFLQIVHAMSIDCMLMSCPFHTMLSLSWYLYALPCIFISIRVIVVFLSCYFMSRSCYAYAPFVLFLHSARSVCMPFMWFDVLIVIAHAPYYDCLYLFHAKSMSLACCRMPFSCYVCAPFFAIFCPSRAISVTLSCYRVSLLSNFLPVACYCFAPFRLCDTSSMLFPCAFHDYSAFRFHVM